VCTQDSARVRSTRGGTTDSEKAASIEKKLKGTLNKNWALFIELLIDHRADFVASVHTTRADSLRCEASPQGSPAN
jgi:hypothetical protein